MMLQLDVYEDCVCDEYVAKILSGLKQRIQKGRKCNGATYELAAEAKSVLLPKWNTGSPDDSILKSLLKDEPREHIKLNEKIWAKFDKLSRENAPSSKTIEKIFDYDGVFNGNGKEVAYWLARITGRNTCTYCNRQYIFTIEKEQEDGEANKIVRPVFDHWFSKSKYPLLSLNLYNLIPSCTICNSSIKGNMVLELDKHIHPYVKDPQASAFKFLAKPKLLATSEWELKIDCEPGSKIDNTIKALELETIYSMHAPLEVKDIMDFNNAYPEGYVNSLLDDLLKKNSSGLSRTDVYRILFGVEAHSDKFLDRPLSKLKHDLLKQIGLEL